MIELREGHKVYAQIPNHFAYSNMRGDFGMAHAEANLCAPKWSTAAARERAAELCTGRPWDVIVMLGTKVAEAFQHVQRSPYKIEPFSQRGYTRWVDDLPGVFRVHSGTLVALPHPSGRCRAWNHPAAIHRARAAMATVLPAIPWGAL